MFHSSIRQSLSILYLLLLFWLQPLPDETFSALAVSLLSNSSQATVEASYDWSEVQQGIAEGVRKIRPSIDEFAANELDRWVTERMNQVDEQFLNWYFGFIHQKVTQDGVPFAWVAFKVDFLDWLKTKDEKGLSPDQIIQRRMLEKIEQKFHELVLNEAAVNDLRDRIKHVARNYASALSIQFELIRTRYHVPDQEWEQHTSQVSQLIYNTGTSESSLSSDSLSSLLATKVITAASVALSSKLAVKFALKMAPKLAIKGGALAVLETGAKFIDPLLVVGFLIWDAADYQVMVNKSRPELRKNIADYLELVKANIYDAPDGSIIAAINQVENQIVDLLVKLES
jgi:hypothetical protein